ncbi:hypothetical protein [Micromonospora sagamiensis]|uniref:Uncharacterized protein n=1 Tax=Micromonospora sagamiensis TaxID=47875 RepID=A0A562WGG0_9ACTN|nr:hypothetical protein [Micromonospora sagamiensis]TWJ29265.1 hypothetical protein JD81_02773 [Micromonospora sagamiensis]BCL17709.1 hypothetical protein GCM10017556_54480 [Micromonospora sagamiensis]
MIRVAVTALGVAASVCAVVVLLTSGSWRAALRILLDLLTAAGLLRLGGAQGWGALAAVAAIVALRRLLWAALAVAEPTVGGAPEDRRAPTPAHRC